MRLTYVITPRSRVSAGKGGQVRNERTAYQHLPGTVVRGALGAAWWTHPSHAYSAASRQQDFETLFGSSLIVHDALPIIDGVDAANQVALLPLSLVRVKYASDQATKPVSGWHDLAASPLVRCPACDAPLPADSGWGRPLDPCTQCGTVFEGSRGGWSIPADWLTASTRTALVNGLAEDEKLFTRLAMPARIRYQGTIDVRGNPPSAAVDWLKESCELSVGGQLSTYGRVRWTVLEQDAVAPPAGKRIVLRTLSPTILIDEWGAPSLDLRGALQSVAVKGRVVRCWQRTTQVSGWHKLAGVPKPVEWALETGSVAVLEDWPAEALARVAGGLGVRRLEGFGAVELVDPAGLSTFGSTLAGAVAAVATTASVPVTAAGSADRAPGKEAVVSRAEAGEEPGDVAQPEAPSDDLTVLLEALTASNRQNTINGLLSALRQAAKLRGTRQPPPVFAMFANKTLDMPWCRELGPRSRDAVRAMVKSPNPEDLITRLQAERRS